MVTEIANVTSATLSLGQRSPTGRAEGIPPDRPPVEVPATESMPVADPFEQVRLVGEQLDRLYPGSKLRLRIDFDRTAGRFVYLGVNPNTGEVVRQFPPETMLRQLAFFRQLAGLAVDSNA